MSQKKILSWSSLKRQLKKERGWGRKVVFTNGCFDLLHVGHLTVFTKCKSWGDVLVVGLNSDASVRRLKGPTRPLVPERERAQLLAGLSAVDYVTLFGENTPNRLIRLVRPDVLVKGGDWKKNQIVGRTVAKRVVRVPLVKGHSTSALIERILDRYGRAP